MEYIIENNHIKIHKSSTNIEQIKTSLTIDPPYDERYNMIKPSKYNLYLEDKDTLTIPKFWAQKELGIKMGYLSYKSSTMEFTKTLRPLQIEISELVIPTIYNTGGGVISIPCGEGKTWLALYLACSLKVKTIVIVNKVFLMNQWIDNIQQCTTAKIGKIQGNMIDVEGKDIVVAMLHSLSMKDYHRSIFADFGFLIVDEVHNICTRTFSQSLLKVTAPYTLGLSATPKRKDNMHYIIFWFLGPILYERTTRSIENVDVFIYNFELSPEAAISDVNKFKIVKDHRTQLPSNPRMITNFGKIDERNNAITKIVLDELDIYPDRCILLLSERIEQLDNIKNKIDNALNDDGYTSFYIGKMKKKELEYAETKQIILATFQMVAEAFNLPKLTMLVMCSSIRDPTRLKQSIGRILRDPKSRYIPKVIDFADKVFAGQAKQRRVFYEKENYNVTYYHMVGLEVEYITQNNNLKPSASKNDSNNYNSDDEL